MIIDANGILNCLSIVDFSLHPNYTDLPYETVSDPEFDRPQIVVSGITIQNGDYEHLSGGLDIYAHKYDVTVKDCIIKNNSSGEGRGGGLSITAAFNLALENNQIYDNTVHETRIYTQWHLLKLK